MISVKRLFAASLAAALLAACAAPIAPPAAVAVQDQVARLWSSDTRAVLTGDAARAFGRQCSRRAPGPIEGVWTPSESQITAMEDDLILLVARKQEEYGESPSPGGFYRQIAGLVIGGRQVIYINGVDESAIRGDTRWRTSPILICDGGPITFGVEYDPTTRQFSNFAFNGAI